MFQSIKTKTQKIKHNINLSKLLIINNSKFEIKIKREEEYKCILCNSINESFNTVEHIVPHSLGNNFLMLDKGWICDTCNNKCSAFESRALNHSSLSFQKVLMVEKTKKGKSPRCTYENVDWYKSENSSKSISLDYNEKKIKKNPFLKYAVENNASAFIQLAHNNFDIDINRLLLKIGVEIAYSFKLNFSYTLEDAKKFILEKDNQSWFYVIIQNKDIKLKSIFTYSDYIYSHVLASNFDIFLYEFNNDLILYFKYGHFLYGVNLSSNKKDWLIELKEEGNKFVVFPKEFAELSFT